MAREGLFDRRVCRTFFAVVAQALLALGISDASAQMTGLNPTPAEIMQLPRFCWSQMSVPNAVGDEFKPVKCGPGTNHYCPGLVKVLRAKREMDSKKRRSLLESAANDVRYTEGYIGSFPACTIRQHVNATKAEIEQLLRVMPRLSQSARPLQPA